MLIKKRIGTLGFVDPKATRTSLLCNWIVKAMEPKDSNLQLVLRHRLAKCNPQRGKKFGGLAWIGLLARNIKVSIGLRFGSISTKLERSWLKGCTSYTKYGI